MEVDETQITDYIRQSPQRTVFCYPWWLDAVTDGNYSYVVVENGENIDAIVPITRTQRFGFSICSMPPFSQSLGVLMSPMQGKYVTQLSNEHKAIDTAIGKLPSCNYFNMRLHPSVTNWLPFYWNGFNQTTRYTYILPDLSDTDAIWKSMRSNIRREIRKAKKQVRVSDSPDIDLLIKMRRMTFERQEKDPAHSDNIIRRIYDACEKRDRCKMFFAIDQEERVHSGLFLVWDDRTAYYLIGGSDPELRTSGAASLLMWEAIQFASDIVPQFNFEGSMVKSIERFFRSFGGQQIPYFEVFKYSPSFLSVIDPLL